MRDHALIAVLLGARLSFEVLIATEDSLFALAQVAEGHAENEGELQVWKICIQNFKLVICLLFLILDHYIIVNSIFAIIDSFY